MKATLYVVPGSHPSATVERALELKGISYEREDLLPVVHRLQQMRRFGGPTVPGLELDGGNERILGSRPIVRRLEELVPEPALLPAERGSRILVERAERWGDEVLQPVARRIAWATLKRSPGSMTSFAEGARLPIPTRVAALGARQIALLGARVNGASDPAVRADLIHLPHHLDRIDGWISDGVLGGPEPNAADLQIGAGLRLLLCLGDLAPLIGPRPAATPARRHFARFPGHVPAGVLPAEWLPAA